MADGTPRLYLVYLDADATPRAAPELAELAPGLYLVRSARSRSQVYHALKRRFAPRRLLVAPLDGDPKFKGKASILNIPSIGIMDAAMVVEASGLHKYADKDVFTQSANRAISS